MQKHGTVFNSYRNISLVFLIGSISTSIGCGGDSSNSGAGSFPNFYTKTKLAVPAVSSSSALSLMSNEMDQRSTPSLGSFLTLPGAYTSSTSDFSTAFSTSQNYIGQVLNDPGPNGPVKSMYVLLNQAQSNVDTINSNYSDSQGSPTNCTAIDSTKTITTPFFATATNAPMVTWSDAGKYTCYAAQNNGYLIFGRQAIAAPTAGCTDAYEYYVLSGYSQQNQTNTASVATRGPTNNISSIQKFYYNGCTTDIKLIYAQSTKYSLGVEFSSRTELLGNTTAHSFTIRSNYIDADTSYATHITIGGTGTSLPASGTTAVNFVMGYRTDNCGTASNSTSCTTGTAYSFCAKNSGTAGNYALDTTTSNCSSYASTYTGITTLERSDLPSTYFEAGTAAAYGL